MSHPRFALRFNQMMHYKNIRTKSFRLAKSNTEGNYRPLSLSNMRHRGVPIKHTTERRKK